MNTKRWNRLATDIILFVAEVESCVREIKREVVTINRKIDVNQVRITDTDNCTNIKIN